MRIPAFVAHVAVLVVFACAAAAQDFVILSSSEPSLAPGSVIRAGQKIQLPALKQLVLVNAAGRTVTVSGPFDGVPGGDAPGDNRLVLALASLVRTTQEESTSVGAIRAAGIRTDREAMMINVSETGDYCLAAGGRPEMTRYQHESAGRVTITAVADGSTRTVDWGERVGALPWPEGMPVEGGATYLVQQAGKDTRTMIVLHRIEDTFPTHAHRALGLAEKGCKEQARMFLALLARAGG